MSDITNAPHSKKQDFSNMCWTRVSQNGSPSGWLESCMQR